jgi:aminoglycoside phosphotransferase (APT) family kinase protein
MSSMHDILPKVQAYINERNWQHVPVLAGRQFTVAPLAQGEYNLNYLISATDGTANLVFRVNIGTQIDRDDQIIYEYRALQLLQSSGFTPRPYFVDDNRDFFDRGILIMEYLPGAPLDYEVDLEAAARLLAGIHQTIVYESENHLIREDAPLTLIFEECRQLLSQYFQSELAQPEIRDYLQQVIDWADAARSRERYYRQDPWPCIVNTEVNSGNFIVNRSKGTIHLVDWEMPRWGDPSQDICHFCSPLTTLWKTGYRMSPATRQHFLATYRQSIADRHLRETLDERIRLREPFVRLRGISWSAMGWVAYQTEFEGMKNPDTWQTLQRYMDLDFIRTVFDRFLKT